MDTKTECAWKLGDADPYYPSWETRCGETFFLLEGTPAENQMKFCPYCGRQLVEVAITEEG